MSRRQAQIESTIRRALAQVLVRKVSDPRIRGLVSVTRVALSPDFKSAIVYVSVIPTQYLTRTLHGLNSGAGMFQSQLAKTMTIKAIPKLEFRHDEALHKETDIFNEIQRGLDREGISAAEIVHVGERDPENSDDETATDEPADDDEWSANTTENPIP